MSRADPTDHTQLAVRIGELAASVKAIQDSQTQMQENGRESARGLRDDLRDIKGKLDVFATAAHATNENTESIRRLWGHVREQDKVLADTNKSASRLGWVAIGVAACLGLAAGAVTYAWKRDSAEVLNAVQRIEARTNSVDDRLDRVEIHAAGDPNRPYKR